VRKAVEAFPGDARIGVLASGGLSHFLVDEDFDRAILKALANKDRTFLETLPRNKLHAGSSEILNWVAIAGAAEGLNLDWFDYVPGYRTPAGTGTGMSFATWGEGIPSADRTPRTGGVCTFTLSPP
jgi:3-O-methylgallate 3,4-dioxygenase